MKYNGYEIKKIDINAYKILDVFDNDLTNEIYRSSVEAKCVIDNVLIPNTNKARFMPTHYRKYWWGVIDKTTSLYYKKEDDKLLLFKRREECFKWCSENNNKP